MLMKTGLALVAAVALAGLVGATSVAPAAAQPRGIYFVKQGPRIIYRAHPRLVFRPGFQLRIGRPIQYRFAVRSNSCSWLRRQALLTGSRYWLRNYENCRFRKLYY